MSRYIVRVVALAGLALGPILAECRPTFAQASASAPADVVMRRSPFVMAQAAGPVPAPEPGIGRPQTRDYERIPALRDVYFDFGMAVIRTSDVKILEVNAAWLRTHPDQLVLIEGHCDSRGAGSRKNEFNMDLGEQRAQAAMNYLVAEGVHPSRILILSYGQERPQCTEESEWCWRQNRRARFLVKPR